MESIPRIGFLLGLVQKELGGALSPERVEAACRAAGHAWRRRKLGPAQAVYLMVLQVLHANTALTHLRRLAGVAASASAICRAKARLPLAALRSLAASVCRAAGAACHGGPPGWRWHGHRVRGADATAFATPDTPALARAFGKSSGHNHKTGKKNKAKAKAKAKAKVKAPKKRPPEKGRRKAARGAKAAGQRAGQRQATGRQRRAARRRPRNVGALGFPVVKALALFDLGAGVLLKLIPLPLHRQEMSVAVRLLAHLGFGDVLVADRAFCSFAWLALLLRVGVEAAVRLPERQRVGTRGRGDGSRPHGTRRRVRRLGPGDWLVRWDKPPRAGQRPGWISRVRWASLPAAADLRQVSYRVRRKGYRTRAVTLITTLLDPARYPAGDLADLYLRRWRVEGCLRSLKQELGMGELRAKTVAGVKKEMLAYAIAYNLVRLAAAKAAGAQGVDPWRISFADAARWMLSAGAGDDLPALAVNPERTGRWEPRVVKRRPKGYCRLSKPREQLRQEVLAKKVA